MKHYMKTSLFTLLVVLSCSYNALAQPFSLKKLGKAIFTLKTYDKQGNLLSSSHGAFVASDGTAIGAWSPFVGASKATAIAEDGKEMDVEFILGANELYDVCKFKVAEGTPFLQAAPTTLSAGSHSWMLSIDGRKVESRDMEIAKTESFMEKYYYYIFGYDDTTSSDSMSVRGMPVVNDKGQLVGIANKPDGATAIQATDARFAMSLKTATLSVSDPLYRQTDIILPFPPDKKDALVMLMLSGDQSDSLRYSRYVESFIKAFPKSVEGYSARAVVKVNHGDFAGADTDMQKAIKESDDKAEAHSEYAKIIYQKMVFSQDTTFKAWSLDKALDEAKKAYSIKPLPAYKHREAQIIYSKGEYGKALDIFVALSKGELRNSEVFFEAAQCKNQLNAPQKEIISLLDSAVALCPRPLTAISAQYFLSRGAEYEKMGDFRSALKDYNVYDTLMVGRAVPEFYYSKFKCELNLKQYQQALNDIAHAAYLSPNEPLYIAEMSSLYLRVKRFDDAIKTADMCIRISPEMTDPYVIKGLALIMKSQTSEGIKQLEKAKELGDQRAQGLIDKYKK